MSTKNIPEGAIPVFTTAGGEEPVGYALRRDDERPPLVVTRAWKVGQWWYGPLGNYWKSDSVQHAWEAVRARAAELRATPGWKGHVEAIPFFCIVDGETVHEVQAPPFDVFTGLCVPERERTIRVDE